MSKLPAVVGVLILMMLFLGGHSSYGDHIVGGELRLEPTGGANAYSVTLVQFWDENNLTIPTNSNAGNRDRQVKLFIYKKGNDQLMDSVTLTYQSSKRVVYQNSSCATARAMNTLQGTYSGTILLPAGRYDAPEGYYMVWERCCRNADIDNIMDPGRSGMAFYVEFPPTGLANASPEFQFPNGQYICVNRRFTMNSSAVDKDGDVLRYTLVTPLQGNTIADINLSVGNSSPKSGYPLVNWENGISLSNVIPGPVPLEINPITGILSVVAGQTGLYVFTVQCEEFRNGKRIGMVRRDFQLLVIDCNLDTPEPPVVTMNLQPVKSVKFCPEKPIQLETLVSPDWAYQWQLNGLNIVGANSEKVMVSDTGKYTVVKSYRNKCASDTASLPIQVDYADPVLAKITPEKLFLCEGEDTQLLANGGTPLKLNHSYVWREDQNQISLNQVKISVDKPNMYYLSITDDLLGCIGKDSVLISVDSVRVNLPLTISILKGNAATVTASVSPGQTGYSYQWEPVDEGFRSDPHMLSAVLSPAKESSYTVVATSPNGCAGAATITVLVFERLHIPTAFTPNNDGINDTFEIFNPKDQILDVRIFNRWGRVIFQSSGYDHPWNGTYQQEPVPAGNYPYMIKTPFGDYRGEIMILR
jgi:gliding motility-associated-like protein